MIQRLFNAGLRFTSLGAKLLLTLYMGRYLGLSDLGTYGLVAAIVAIAIPVVGFRLDYTVSREIVDATPLEIARKMRDQVIFYSLTYLALGATLFSAWFAGWLDVSFKLTLFTFLLAILESLTTITSTNLISLRQPVMANIVFFVRAALWNFPVIALGILYADYRSADVIFEWWLAFSAISILITFYILRHLPWKETMHHAVDWPWILSSTRRCLPMWLSSIGFVAANYIDRFVVEFYLGRDYVGIASFYGSFILAISALIDSGIFSFATPHFISLHKKNDAAGLRHETIKVTWQASLSAGFLAIAIGVIVPMLGELFERPEFAKHKYVLWLLLFSVWLKTASSSLNILLYAHHRDRAIWGSNFLLLAVSAGSSFVLVPLMGFIGIGYSAVLSAVALGLWRVFCLINPRI